MFSAVRSADSSPAAGPSRRAMTAPARRRSPSPASSVISAEAARRLNTSIATGSPARTISWRVAITSFNRVSAGMTASVVMSPLPKSSAKAASTATLTSAGSGWGVDKGLFRRLRHRARRRRHLQHFLQWLEALDLDPRVQGRIKVRFPQRLGVREADGSDQGIFPGGPGKRNISPTGKKICFIRLRDIYGRKSRSAKF